MSNVVMVMNWRMAVRLGWSYNDRGWTPTSFSPLQTRKISGTLPEPDTALPPRARRQFYILFAIEEVIRRNGYSADRDMSITLLISRQASIPVCFESPVPKRRDFYFDHATSGEPIRNDRGFLLTENMFRVDLVPPHPHSNSRFDGKWFSATDLGIEYMAQTLEYTGQMGYGVNPSQGFNQQSTGGHNGNHLGVTGPGGVDSRPGNVAIQPASVQLKRHRDAEETSGDMQGGGKRRKKDERPEDLWAQLC